MDTTPLEPKRSRTVRHERDSLGMTLRATALFAVSAAASAVGIVLAALL